MKIKLLSKNDGVFYVALALSIVSIAAFMTVTGIIKSPLVLFIFSLFILIPYRREAHFARRLMLISSLLFAGWLLSFLGYALIPFFIAFMIAYLLDPIISWMSKHRIPRWLSALVIILLMVGIVGAIAILVFPNIFSQVDDAIRRISALLKDTSKYLESRRFYNALAKMGIPRETLKNVVQQEVIPKIDSIFAGILYALLSLLTKLSMLGTQIVNIILVPIMTFYLLKDFPKLKKLISKILVKKNEKLLSDMRRINRIFKIYIGWQITAAIIIGSSTSFLFSIFGVPYPIMLGVICGFLNPIPYLGSLTSLAICIVTILIVYPANFLQMILVVVVVINGLHFINAYLLEPNIAGKQVGLHPILLIASLFVFGGLFGFVGLLIAVPSTAAIMLFFNDWMAKSIETPTEESEGQTAEPEPET